MNQETLMNEFRTLALEWTEWNDKRQQFLDKIKNAKLDPCEFTEFLHGIYWNELNHFITARDLAEAFGLAKCEVHDFIGGQLWMKWCEVCGEQNPAELRTKNDIKKSFICPSCLRKREEDKSRRVQQWNEQNKQRIERLAELKSMPYGDYLQTEEWKQIRQKKLRAANFGCELCGRRIDLRVHHRNYKNRGEENLSDLIVLCKDCHSKVHDRTEVSRAN